MVSLPCLTPCRARISGANVCVVLPTVTAQSSDCQNARNKVSHTKPSPAANLTNDQETKSLVASSKLEDPAAVSDTLLSDQLGKSDLIYEIRFVPLLAIQPFYRIYPRIRRPVLRCRPRYELMDRHCSLYLIGLFHQTFCNRKASRNGQARVRTYAPPSDWVQSLSVVSIHLLLARASLTEASLASSGTRSCTAAMTPLVFPKYCEVQSFRLGAAAL